MTRRIYVVDTSYLLELFKVDGFSSPGAADEVRARFVAAFQNNHEIFVPLPCLFELGNHIADIPDGGRRRSLAHTLSNAVKQGFETQTPWTILPSLNVEEVHPLLDAFSSDWAGQGIGVTDAFTIAEAGKLKRRWSASLGYAVHIWTKDRRLKAQEPDQEPNAFVN